MNCLIVDDQTIFRKILVQFLALDQSLKLIGECDNAMDAYSVIKKEQVDIVFLDIAMDGMSGIDLAKIIQNQTLAIIFTTSMKEHAPEAFDLNVVDFLVKPIAPIRFMQAVEKAKARLNLNPKQTIDYLQGSIFIRDSHVVRKLNLDDILFFEGTGDYVKVQMTNQTYSIHSSLKTIQQKLVGKHFFRVHRSFIINITKIDSTEGKTLLLNKHLIPVSDSVRTELNKIMNFL